MRNIFNESNNFQDSVLYNDDYFTNFNLVLPDKSEDKKNPFNELNYRTLGGYEMQFNLRPIRCVIVKQNSPKNDNSSVFEIFNRLNSGGINLSPQEIRSSLYHSSFIDLLVRLNLNSVWRKFLRSPDADFHMKDVELLLRGFAMAINGDSYKSSLANFLNKFASDAKKLSSDDINYYNVFTEHLFNIMSDFPDDTFINKKTGRFNTFLFEALMYAEGKLNFREKKLPSHIALDVINQLAYDSTFQEYSIKGTTNKASVTKRLERATSIINA